MFDAPLTWPPTQKPSLRADENIYTLDYLLDQPQPVLANKPDDPEQGQNNDDARIKAMTQETFASAKATHPENTDQVDPVDATNDVEDKKDKKSKKEKKKHKHEKKQHSSSRRKDHADDEGGGADGEDVVMQDGS